MEENKIIATGVGRRAVEPTISSVRLRVEDRLPTAAEVQSSVAQKCDTLLAYLRSHESVTKLHTSGVYLAPQFQYNARPPVVIGYTANNTISFELPVEHTGAIVSGVMTNGATAICGVSFKASEEVQQQARLDAVKLAVKKASAEAHAGIYGVIIRSHRPELQGTSAADTSHAVGADHYRARHRHLPHEIKLSAALRSCSSLRLF